MGERVRMSERRITDRQNSNIIDGIVVGFSAALFLGAAAGAWYTGTGATLLSGFYRILITPGPLVTDYFNIGSLPATLLNSGLCGSVMALFMILLPGPSHVNTLAGYFLVIAHCFCGLNFLNMWPCFLAPFLYLHLKKLDYNQNLHVCMFSTCFSPFVSEFLFRYTRESMFRVGSVNVDLEGIFNTLIFTLIIAFVAPAVLPGVRAWHKGYNLYNGGLAYGLFGFLLYNFLYRTMGVPAPVIPQYTNEIYDSFGHSYKLFGNVFFLLLFLICFAAGWYLNGRSL